MLIAFGLVVAFWWVSSCGEEADAAVKIDGVAHCGTSDYTRDGIGVTAYSLFRVRLGAGETAVIKVSDLCGAENGTVIYASGADGLYYVQGRGVIARGSGGNFDLVTFAGEELVDGYAEVVEGTDMAAFVVAWLGAQTPPAGMQGATGVVWVDDGEVTEAGLAHLNSLHGAFGAVVGAVSEVRELPEPERGEEVVGWDEEESDGGFVSVGFGGVTVLIIGLGILAGVLYWLSSKLGKGGDEGKVYGGLIGVTTLGMGVGLGYETGVVTGGLLFILGGTSVVLIAATLYRRVLWPS